MHEASLTLSLCKKSILRSSLQILSLTRNTCGCNQFHAHILAHYYGTGLNQRGHQSRLRSTLGIYRLQPQTVHEWLKVRGYQKRGGDYAIGASRVKALKKKGKKKIEKRVKTAQDERESGEVQK